MKKALSGYQVIFETLPFGIEWKNLDKTNKNAYRSEYLYPQTSAFLQSWKEQPFAAAVAEELEYTNPKLKILSGWAGDDIANTWKKTVEYSGSVISGSGIIVSLDNEYLNKVSSDRLSDSVRTARFTSRTGHIPTNPSGLCLEDTAAYTIAGYNHHWGFIRQELEQKSNSTVIKIASCHRIDGKIMAFLSKHPELCRQGNALEIFGKLFEYVPHDYMHSLLPPGGPNNGLYDLGKHSPIYRFRKSHDQELLPLDELGMKIQPPDKKLGTYERFTSLVGRDVFTQLRTAKTTDNMLELIEKFEAELIKIKNKAIKELGIDEATKISKFLWSMPIWSMQSILSQDDIVTAKIKQKVTATGINYYELLDESNKATGSFYKHLRVSWGLSEDFEGTNPTITFLDVFKRLPKATDKTIERCNQFNPSWAARIAKSHESHAIT